MRAARFDASTLTRRRDWSFRRIPARRVRSARAARALVDAVGCCSTFYRFPEGMACLWEAVAGRCHPRWPRRSHHDADLGLTWHLKDALPAARHVYYGKLLKGRPMLVALDVFSACYALVRGRQRSVDYVDEYRAGRLSHTAKRIMDALANDHPQYTRGIRAASFMLEPTKTQEFERAMAELQQGLWVVKTEERYEPTFSYRWDLVDSWLPQAVAEGRSLSAPAAVARLLDRHLAGAIFAREGALARLFGLSSAAVDDALSDLERRRRIQRDCSVEGWPGRWVVTAHTR